MSGFLLGYSAELSLEPRFVRKEHAQKFTSSKRRRCAKGSPDPGSQAQAIFKMPRKWYFLFIMAERYTPETGYPAWSFDADNPKTMADGIADDDIFVFVRGDETRELTGYQVKENMRAHWRTPAGQAGLERIRTGTPLFTVLGNEDETVVYLETPEGSVDVTAVEPEVVTAFEELQYQPPADWFKSE